MLHQNSQLNAYSHVSILKWVISLAGGNATETFATGRRGWPENRKKDLYSKYDKTCEKGYIFVALKYYTLWYSEFEDELFIS